MANEYLCFTGRQWSLAAESARRLKAEMYWPAGLPLSAEKLYYNVPKGILLLPRGVALYRVAHATTACVWRHEMLRVRRFMQSVHCQKSQVGFLDILVQRGLALYHGKLHRLGVRCVAELFRATDRGYLPSRRGSWLA